MRVLVNGEGHELPPESTVATVVERLGPRRAQPADAPPGSGPRTADQVPGVAVAVNGDVVARRDWHSRPLTEGDRVELLVAIQGG